MNKSLAYAVAALVQIAAHRGDSALPSSTISECTGIPPRYLLHILRRLSSAGLLKSLRGIQGGYRLAKPATQISLCEIYESVGRYLDQPNSSIEGLTVASQRIVTGVLQDFSKDQRRRLSAFTLDMLQDANV